jgi:hypothetical protein
MLVSQKYPKTTIYMEPRLKAKVQALGTIQNRAAWKIIEEALERYLSELPAKDRQAIELLASRVRGSNEAER